MLLGKADGVVGHAPSRLWRVAQAHIVAYQYDMDTLMATVSPNGGIWAGVLPVQGAVILRTPDEIRESYTNALAAVQMGEPEAYVAATSDWYVLLEVHGEATEKISGRSFEGMGLGLFGADEIALAIDTDVGAIVSTERSIEPGQTVARQRLGDARAHQTRLEALCSGDIDSALTGVGEQLDLFLPLFDPDDRALETYVADRNAYRAYLEQFLGRFRIEHSEQANLITTSSWVFSEVEWTLADTRTGGTVEARFALCEVLAKDGSVRGGVGVAVEA